MDKKKIPGLTEKNCLSTDLDHKLKKVNKATLFNIVLQEPIPMGRICSYFAKLLLKEKEFFVYLNCDNVVVTGKRKTVEKERQEKRKRGSRYKGPFFPNGKEERIRRCYRGMVNYTTRRGIDAYRRFFTSGGFENMKKKILKRNKEGKTFRIGFDQTKELVFDRSVIKDKEVSYFVKS